MKFATKIVDELMSTKAFGATLILHEYLINYRQDEIDKKTYGLTIYYQIWLVLR